MGSTQVKKKPRKNFCSVAHDGDLISDLPESVICHILSRLPSKDAMRTSILSKDWEFKWTLIYNIDIDDLQFSNQRRKKTCFVNFVDRVLLLSHQLKSFRLSCRDKYDCNRLTGWISAALRKNVENFELNINYKQELVLPRSLVSNISLRKLVLKSPCTFKVPLDSYYPNIMYLYLKEVEIQNMLSNSDPLVFTFPVLKTFELVRCKWSNVNLVEIYSPALRAFKCETDWRAGINGYSIKICGARLKNFVSNGGFPENITLHESVVLDAYFQNHSVCYKYKDSDLQTVYSLQVQKLLKGFSCVTHLQLSEWMCMAIAQTKQELQLPQFDRLQRLAISLRRDAKLLFELLHLAPSLKFLEIRAQGIEEFDSDEVDPVSCCVISHLQEVKIMHTHEQSLIHLSKLFLMNGVELKKFYHSSNCSAEDVEQVLKLPRAAACLEIVSE